eukprot:8265840-Pyramimonas_sp.AAC.1
MAPPLSILSLAIKERVVGCLDTPPTLSDEWGSQVLRTEQLTTAQWSALLRRLSHSAPDALEPTGNL